MESATSRSEPLSQKEDIAAIILLTDDDKEFVMEAEKVRPTHAGMLRMILSAILVSKETTVDRRMEEKVETEVVGLFKAANHEAVKSESTLLYQAVENLVRRGVTRGAVNEVIHMKIDDLTKW